MVSLTHQTLEAQLFTQELFLEFTSGINSDTTSEQNIKPRWYMKTWEIIAVGCGFIDCKFMTGEVRRSGNAQFSW